jgi:predicted O-methyltransferase YrrM
MCEKNFQLLLSGESGKNGLNFLQLGTFTGDASVWMLENVLNGDNSKLTDVDTWAGSEEESHQKMNFENVYEVYLEKIAKYAKQVRVCRLTTTDFLLGCYGVDRPWPEEFDFIYIDADHTAVGTLLDAELSWPLLKQGGILAFDDYEWNHTSGETRLAPKIGIDLFLHRHRGNYQLLVANWQLWIRKTGSSSD